MLYSQLMCCVSGLKASLCALEAVTSCICRDEIADIQTESRPATGCIIAEVEFLASHVIYYESEGVD